MMNITMPFINIPLWVVLAFFVPPVVMVLSFIYLMNKDKNSIECYIFNQNRHVRKVKVNPRDRYFKLEDKQQVYMIDQKAVNISVQEGKKTIKPECYYYEDNPKPVLVSYTEEKKPEEEYGGKGLLGWMLFRNFIKQMSKPTGLGKIFRVMGYYKENPEKLLMLVIVLAVGYSIIATFIGI